MGYLYPFTYVKGAAREAGAAAEVAASRKEDKCADLDSRCLFKPIAVETIDLILLPTAC